MCTRSKLAVQWHAAKNFAQRRLTLCLNALSLPLPLQGPACRPARSFIAHSPIGLSTNHVRTSLCGREMASEPNMLKRDGGALSSGNSTLMQRERGKKEAKAGKRKQRFGRSVKSVGRRAGVGRGGWAVCVARWAGRRARVGRSAKVGRQTTVGKRQRGSKLSNKQEKAKGRAQEV